LASSETVDVELEEVMEYELCPLALSLYDEDGFMRETTKADLGNWLIEGLEFETDAAKVLRNREVEQKDTDYRGVDGRGV